MKVAVITGAANGIGLALSQVHLQKDDCIVMVDINTDKLYQEAERLRLTYPKQILAIPCDIRSESAVRDLVVDVKKEYGRVDWLYNNAGIMGELAPVWELQMQNLRQVMDVNLFAMIHLIQAFSPLLFAQTHRSRIINMASMYALCTGTQLTSYAISKHAVLALSESLYFDLNRLQKPVDVSVVFPSFTDTALLSNPALNNNLLHDSLKSLLTHSRPAMDVAEHIVQEVDNNRFYIFPDKEVKGYCEERLTTLLLQENPHHNNINKLITSLLKRSEK